MAVVMIRNGVKLCERCARMNCITFVGEKPVETGYVSDEACECDSCRLGAERNRPDDETTIRLIIEACNAKEFYADAVSAADRVFARLAELKERADSLQKALAASQLNNQTLTSQLIAARNAT